LALRPVEIGKPISIGPRPSPSRAAARPPHDDGSSYEQAAPNCCGAILYGSLPANKGKRNAGRRVVHEPMRKRRTGRATKKAACAAPPLRARSPAGVPPRLCPRGVVVPWCDPGQVSWESPSRGGGHSADGRTHIQRRTSHAGHNAGGHDARTAREQGASLPAGSASRPTAAVCLRGGVLSAGEVIR
jgi:hypothetical protein